MNTITVLTPRFAARRLGARFLAGALALSLLSAAVAPAPGLARPARIPSLVFEVTTTFDGLDTNPGDTHCDVSPDPGDQCTLRAAVMETNSLAGAHEIHLDSGTYILLGGADEDNSQSGDLDVKGSITVSGSDIGPTVIDGGATDRIFQVFGGAALTLRSVSLRNGKVSGNWPEGTGGALRVMSGSSTTLENSQVLSSTATYGGGIFNESLDLNLVDSQVGYNQAAFGGGVNNNFGRVTLLRSTLHHNHADSGGELGGGGLYSQDGEVVLTDSQVFENSTPQSGGGLCARNSAAVQLVHTEVLSNTADMSGAAIYISSSSLDISISLLKGNQADLDGGGIFARNGALTLDDNTLQNNISGRYGGGLFSEQGSLLLQASTLYGNIADYGGGLFVYGGPANLNNVTLSQNWAWGYGGGLYVDHHPSGDQNVSLNNVTMAYNRANADGQGSETGGGIFVEPGVTSQVRLKNSLLSVNFRGFLLPMLDDCNGSLYSQDYNLIQTLTGCDVSGMTGNNITGSAADLGPLQDNGGPTWTHLPPAGSPVIDAANPLGCQDHAGVTLVTDQRGLARSVDGDGLDGARCDMGSTELAPNPVPVLTQLLPNQMEAGSPEFTLTLVGSNFVNGAAAQWDSTVLLTTYISSTQLTAQVPASLLLTPGAASVTVSNPQPGGGASNALTFTILDATVPNPVPVLSQLTPQQMQAGLPGFTLTLSGSGFVSGSTARWNGSDLVTTYISSTQLTVQVAASALLNPGNIPVTVFNPSPGGGLSNALTFTILAAPGSEYRLNLPFVER